MATLALSACAPEAPVRGTAPGPTFVSLNPCIDAILIEVAAPRQILALSHYSRDPASSSIDPQSAARFGVTGGTAEEVIALEPDIVLASTFIAPATRAALERAGLRVESFGSPATTQESVDQIRELAALTGDTRRAQPLIARIDATAPPALAEGKSVLLWQAGQIVPGEATLVAEHLRWAGLSSHSAAMGLGQSDFVSLEAVLADPPDLLLVAGDARGQTHPLLGQIAGTHIAHFDPSLFYCGGPSIPRARERLIEIRREAARQWNAAS